MRLLLSICIPTYNRAIYLNELLLSIGKIPNGVEIIVSDNHSEDETEQICGKFISSGIPIRYFRADSNEGFAANIQKVSGNARGEYVWLCGDDELFEPGAIDSVLGVLQEKPDVVLLNYSVWSVDMKRLVVPSWSVSNSSRTSLEASDIGIVNLNTVTFLSCLVIRNSASAFECMAKFEGNHYIHSFAVLYFYKPFNWRVCRKAILRQRLAAGRGPRTHELFVESMPELIHFARSQGVPDEDLKEWKRLFFKRTVIRSCLGHKIDTGFCLPLLKSVTRDYSFTWQYWALFLPMYLLPRTLLQIIRGRFSLNRKKES